MLVFQTSAGKIFVSTQIIDNVSRRVTFSKEGQTNVLELVRSNDFSEEGLKRQLVIAQDILWFGNQDRLMLIETARLVPILDISWNENILFLLEIPSEPDLIIVICETSIARVRKNGTRDWNFDLGEVIIDARIEKDLSNGAWQTLIDDFNGQVYSFDSGGTAKSLGKIAMSWEERQKTNQN